MFEWWTRDRVVTSPALPGLAPPKPKAKTSSAWEPVGFERWLAARLPPSCPPGQDGALPARVARTRGLRTPALLPSPGLRQASGATPGIMVSAGPAPAAGVVGAASRAGRGSG